MFAIKKIKIRFNEIGLLFKDDKLEKLLPQGEYRFFDPAQRLRIDICNTEQTWLTHPQLDRLLRSGLLADETETLDLQDNERALVWVDGRFHQIAGPGLHLLWKAPKQIRVEKISAAAVHFEHPQLDTILAMPGSTTMLEEVVVEQGFSAVIFYNGVHLKTCSAGRYAFWKGAGPLQVRLVDLRETAIDISGQEIMAKDHVTLRFNAQLSFQIHDPLRAATLVENLHQALYRETQLALREVIGSFTVDDLLQSKDAAAREMERIVRTRCEGFGLNIVRLGIRDLILPGEMKELLNQVIQARKAAEANLIVRREETAAMRSQANTARLLDNNPTLMRLRELEVLEKIAGHSKLNVVLGEKGLADKIVNLL